MLGHQFKDVRQRDWLPVLVHMSGDQKSFERQLREITGGNDTPPSIPDPDSELRQAAGIPRGGIRHVAGPRIWWRGLKAVLFKGHRPGKPEGDVMRLAAVLLVRERRIVGRWIAPDSASHPDLPGLIDSLPPADSSPCGS